MSDELKHYGTPRHSGRFPWGSGDDPYQRNTSFVGQVEKLKNQGLKETEIAKGMNMNTTELRKRISLARNDIRAYEAGEAQRLLDKGYSKSAIARRMGKNESSVRLLLNPVLKTRSEATKNLSDVLKDAVDEKGLVDVGKGMEQYLDCSYGRLTNAVERLKRDGYVIHHVTYEQLGTGKDTTMTVLCPPGTEWKYVKRNMDKIQMVTDVHSEDGGNTFRKMEPPRPISSERVMVRYAEQGGDKKDGVIELRRGVPDLDLHNAKYAQVRIAVDGTHYIKGMAIPSDNVPPGVDVVFNTNKKVGTPMLGPKDNTVLKPTDLGNPENPFGASIKPDDKILRARQRHYIDENGKEQLSSLNIVNEEGNWNSWSKNLASQMLSKQSPSLAKQQLDLSHAIAKDEFDEIMSLTNPTVRASLLNKFADQCDSDATHLQAAALPRQATKVLLPLPNLPETEVFAPGFRDGEHVALIRYPHGGIFEIPTLTVNKKNAEGKEILAQAIDAIGIHPKVAEKLSGADFDGDTVLVIPIDNVKLKTAATPKGLIDFNPREAYPKYPGMHEMTSHEKGVEMGKVSNLITDMTVKGATPDDIAWAVRHSMVVIDAEKHHLDYKRSEIENHIVELRMRYQDGKEKGGASTLLSQSTAEVRVDQRKEKAIRNMTPDELADYRAGKMVWEDTKKTFMKGHELKSGEVRYKETKRQTESSRMMETDDAYTLVSGTPESTTRIESVYASYANSMKALAMEARKQARMEVDVPYDPSAHKVYAAEVESLQASLNLSLRNAPLERQAQLIANKKVATKVYNKPELKKDYERLKRLKGQELEAARALVGAKKPVFWISDKEWEAINAGAISKSFLKSILNNADTKRVRELATPRSHKGLSAGKVARARSMLGNGHDQADVADMLGVSVSTLLNAIGIDQF